MREILFRGKRVDGDWVIGQYIKACAHWHKRGIHEDWIAIRAIQNGGMMNILGRFAVIPETVGQFTGVYDKNGNKIFEGDIVCTGNTDGEICSLGDVKFECGTFGVEWTVNKKNKWLVGVWGQRHNLRRFDDGIGDDIVVIGNIHDNPELLEIEK